ncbi:MAG: PilZN3 domain-containing protein [Alkalispirochaeta sp.]
MDRRRLQQKRTDYADRVLRLDRSLMRRIGLIRNRTHLKIDGHFLNCIPYDLSLKTCRVISILDSKEVEFFGKYRDSTHNLHLTIDNALFGREISMFAKVRLKDVRQPNPETSVSLIDLELVTVPNDLAEILVVLFEELDQARTRYDQAVAAEPPRSLADIYPSWPHRHGRVERGGEMIVGSARIITIAPHRVRLFADLPEGAPQTDGSVEVVFGDGDDPLFVKGSISAVDDSQEVPQCVILTVELEFSAPFVERLSAAMQTADSTGRGDRAPVGDSQRSAERNAESLPPA